MPNNNYYSTRNDKNPLTIHILLEQFFEIYKIFVEIGFFQETFGYHCEDFECIESFGKYKSPQQIYTNFLLQLNKKRIYPIEHYYEGYSEDDLFDVIEYLYNNISLPVNPKYHFFFTSKTIISGRGPHYIVDSYDKEKGQVRWRSAMNRILEIYKRGYFLTEEGYIEQVPPKGLEPLLEEPLIEYDPKNVNNRVDAAIEKFKLSRNSLEDKLNAIRDLAGVLEFLQKNDKLKVGLISNADETDIFKIANSYAIRHHNNTQKVNYNKDIWYDWIFYSYLNTISAVVKELATIAAKENQQEPPE